MHVNLPAPAELSKIEKYVYAMLSSRAKARGERVGYTRYRIHVPDPNIQELAEFGETDDDGTAIVDAIRSLVAKKFFDVGGPAPASCCWIPRLLIVRTGADAGVYIPPGTTSYRRADGRLVRVLNLSDPGVRAPEPKPSTPPPARYNYTDPLIYNWLLTHIDKVTRTVQASIGDIATALKIPYATVQDSLRRLQEQKTIQRVNSMGAPWIRKRGEQATNQEKSIWLVPKTGGDA